MGLNKQKILILSSSFPRYDGDFAGNFVYELAKRLKLEDLSVIIIAPNDSTTKFQENMNGLNVYRFPYFFPYNLQKLAYGGGISYNIKKSLLAKIQVPLFFFSELFYSIKTLKKENIDIIHSNWLMPQGLIGALCKKIFGIPHLATIHSSEITLLQKIPGGRKIAEFIIKNTDVVISVSLHRAEELSNFISPTVSKVMKEKIKIIPMGVTIELQSEKNKDELKIKYGIKSKFIILFAGRLVEVKGCEYLIESFKLIISKFNDCQLIIIGNGPLETKLKKLTEELDLKNYVRFEGFVDHNKISEYYSLSDIIVVPSIVDSSGYQEGLPVVMLEALVLGKPVVATRTKGVMEVIKDNYNGILVEQKDSQKISDAILMLLNNPQLRERISKNAYESSKNYDWDTITEKYTHIIKKIGERKYYKK